MFVCVVLQPSPPGYNSYQQYPQPQNSGLGGLFDKAGAAIAGALGTAGIMRGMGGVSIVLPASKLVVRNVGEGDRNVLVR